MTRRVCIDARLETDAVGGIAQLVIGLAHGLSQLSDGDEEYHFLALESRQEWIAPYLRGRCRLLVAPRPSVSGHRSLLARSDLLRGLWDRFSPWLGRGTFRVPGSDGTIEKAGMGVMHFTFPGGFLTAVPSVYQPHDLQHVHLPEFFNPRNVMTRTLLMKALCDQARVVAVVSSWVKQDVLDNLGVAADKVAVTPYAPVLEGYAVPAEADLRDAQQKFDLPPEFIFYPARTFPHKNHLRLFEALYLLRENGGQRVTLICSGSQTDYFPHLERSLRQFGLEGQVRFTGFVTGMELQCLYRLCRAVIVPSLFEAASFPLWEAFLAGAPAACSNVTSLPAQAGDAALLFDPRDTHAIAGSLLRLWTDEALRQTLIVRGRTNVARFTWERTARHYRALYRQIAGWPLTEEDRTLLAAPAML